MFQMDWCYVEGLEKLWFSDKTTIEDKEWVNKISTKKRFTFTQKEMIQELCIKVFGKFPLDR